MTGLVLVSSLTACGLTPTAENKAVSNARDTARRMSNVLIGARSLWRARDIGRRASEMKDAEVLKVSGTSRRDGDGVRLIIRVEGRATDAMNADEVVARPCFEFRVSDRVEWDTTPPKVDCPPNPPLTFGPWPKDPELPSVARLRKAVPGVPKGGRADEAKVRRAVEALRLDPAIITEYLTQGDTVGVSLTVKPYLDGALDCVLVRVAPGRTDVFVPSTIQRMPGEGGCSAGNAISPMPPPH
ncbi:translation initiation factor IF-2 [Actinomadura logoneensis]|uniref:Translation initiation factor IF-2 n=1 Tax=Actinomadura logoneensis TaxID=2293572 RepID=A0A372JLD1_9ACTN|nr:translation initiation factor IF-2 [Actinomadura logoneensis]